VVVPGPEPEDSPADLLTYVHLQPEPFATAQDINEKTAVGYKQTRNRLDDLVEDGYLKRRKVGTTKVYWLSDTGREFLAEQSE